MAYPSFSSSYAIHNLIISQTIVFEADRDQRDLPWKNDEIWIAFLKIVRCRGIVGMDNLARAQL